MTDSRKPLKLTELMIWDGITDQFSPGVIQIENGSLGESCSYAPSRIPMKGCWAIPGFTDSHVHLVNYAIAQSCLFLDKLSLEEIRMVLQGAVAKLPRGLWIRGRGWELAYRKQSGFPDRAEIDAITPDNPVVLSSKDGHSLWVNTCALKEIGIIDEIADPAGGRFDRRPDGVLSGVILENAVDIVRAMVPAIPDTEKRRMLKDALPGLYSQGIVAAHSFEGLAEMDLLAGMSAAGELLIKLTASFNHEDLDEAIRRGLTSGCRIEGVQIGGLKLYADGALGSRSASVSRHYNGEPLNFGMEVMSMEQMRNLSAHAANHGLATAIHAIGDRAVHHSLDALICARAIRPDLNGFRLEHIQLIQKEDLLRLASSGIVASVQPCHLIGDIPMVERFWKEQTGMLYPYASMSNSGTLIVFGTDAPIENENPLWNIDAAVMRKGRQSTDEEDAWHADERMDVVEAFRAATSSPARLERPCLRRGLLRTGHPADIVLLDRNPFEAGTRPGMANIVAVFIDGIQVV